MFLAAIEKFHKTFPKAILAGSALLFFLLAYAVLVRHNDERASRLVEICVSLDETEEMLDREQMSNSSGALSFITVLERLKILGVSSVFLRTQSIADLAEQGKLIFFSKEEIEKMKALGLVSPGILRANLMWIKKDTFLLEKLLRNIPGTRKIESKSGDFFALENEKEWQKLKGLPLAPELEQLRLLQSLGLSFVLEPWGDCSFPETAVHSFSGWIQLPVREFKERKEQEFTSDCAGKFIFFENDPLTPWFKAAFLHRPEKFVRAHTIFPQEMEKQSPKVIRSRWLRAVRERSCRFLYFRWNSQLSLEENLDLLRAVKDDLKSNGFILKQFSLSKEKVQVWKSYSFRSFRLSLAFVLAILVPCSILLFLRESVKKTMVSSFYFIHALKIWLTALLLAVLGSLFFPVLLSDSVFIRGLEQFRGVKLSLLLPFLIFPWILFQRQELVQILRKKISLWQFMLLLLVLVGIGLVLVRSGNFGIAVFPVELEFRLALENFLGVRPRFKEFLVGHPLLLLGIYLLLKERGKKKSGREWLGNGFLLLGAVAPISILNSFCHLHTPISISLLRTFHGAWLGALLGAGVIFILRFHYLFIDSFLQWRNDKMRQ